MKQLIQEHLKRFNLFIDYNGENYTILKKDNTPIVTLTTPNEISAYIIGFNNAYKELEQRNNTNIKRYEGIIDGLSKDKTET